MNLVSSLTQSDVAGPRDLPQNYVIYKTSGGSYVYVNMLSERLTQLFYTSSSSNVPGNGNKHFEDTVHVCFHGIWTVTSHTGLARAQISLAHAFT